MNRNYQLSEIEHHYPKQVHLLKSGYVSSLLTTLSQSQTVQPLFNDLLTHLYRDLFVQVLNDQWPIQNVQVPTRMTEHHRDCFLEGQVFDSQQKAVCVDIARAGMLPSQTLFDLLNRLVQPEGIRQDHIFASRVTNSNGEVSHTELSSSKIGGDIKDAFVFLPDPMGATGNSLVEVIDYYKKNIAGPARAFISLNLIITPEFVRRLTTAHPDTLIYAARIDRGLSPQDTKEAAPGQYWDKEKGLNDSQYIVPGAGGVGEIINNSYV